MTMENFFSYISKPIDPEEFEFWVESNNICFLKLELYETFVKSLVNLISQTYLGESEFNETNINVTEQDINNHFDWCWDKTVENFKKEKIFFENDGEHKKFIREFIFETFYLQKNKDVKSSLDKFFNEIFDIETSMTKSDLDLLTTIYKLMEKNVKVNLQ